MKEVDERSTTASGSCQVTNDEEIFEMDVQAIFWHLREYSERYPHAFREALSRLELEG